MTTTIDKAGRIVVPKSIREAAGLSAGIALNISVNGGRIEIEPVSHASLVKKGPFLIVDTPAGDRPLDAAMVEETIDAIRSERSRG